ncbi:hypothetical protein RUND412_008647 [Rhizina undulata]
MNNPHSNWDWNFVNPSILFHTSKKPSGTLLLYWSTPCTPLSNSTPQPTSFLALSQQISNTVLGATIPQSQSSEKQYVVPSKYRNLIVSRNNVERGGCDNAVGFNDNVNDDAYDERMKITGIESRKMFANIIERASGKKGRDSESPRGGAGIGWDAITVVEIKLVRD